MEFSLDAWKKLGINRKFRLIFVLLLALILCIGFSVYFSLNYINKLGRDIEKNNAIVQHVLEMDRGLERARRLHGDFFLYYQVAGLQNAHERYAQPSVREISHVISHSSELKDLLYEEEMVAPGQILETNINLYLALANRFAETSIEAVELISSRAAPERGIEDQLNSSVNNVRKLLQKHPLYLAELSDGMLSFKDYLIKRKRHHMQSALNSFKIVEKGVEQETDITAEIRQVVPQKMQEIERLAEDLLRVDLEIDSKLRDFSLQAQTITPISEALVEKTKESVVKAQEKIRKAHIVTGCLIFITLIIALFVILMISRLVKGDITTKVVELTEAASEFSRGNRNARVIISSNDEIGQLAEIYNFMAERLSDLIDNLELKVKERTVQLSESEERFRKLVNELPQIAVQGLNKRREIVYWNKTSELLLGYSEQEALGEIYEDLIIPENDRQILATFLSDRKEAQTGPPAPAEQILISKDGEEKLVFSAYEIQLDQDGNPIIYCIHLDLTELKQAQNKSLISEAFYRELFDHSSSGVVVYKPMHEGEDFIILDFNRAAEAIEGVSRKDVIGKSLKQIFPGVEEFGLLQVLRKVSKTGNSAYVPATHYNDERIQGWRENRVYKLPSGEIVAVYNDVTAQKKSEDERVQMERRLQRAEKMEAIGLMAGGIAHDLNNILSAIVGYPELILMQLEDESELREPLKAIHEAGERAATVVADLLTVARGVAHNRSHADVSILAEEYVGSPEFLQLKSTFPHIEFVLELDRSLAPIECSSVHVKKCLMNLMVNGAEAVEGEGKVSLQTRPCRNDSDWKEKRGLERQMDYVVVSITDTGKGIPEKDIAHIFEPFYTKKVMGKRSGTGLGLSVVWNTMKEHGGTVLVESSEEGSCFELYFPGCADVIVTELDEDSTLAMRGNGEKVLVIDDEKSQCELACSILEYLGYTSAYVLSGEEALAYVQREEVDILLLDMIMDPGINGRVTYERICRIKPSQKAIIVSGYSESEDVKTTIKMGAGCIIQKPYGMKELGKALQQELIQKAPAQ